MRTGEEGWVVGRSPGRRPPAPDEIQKGGEMRRYKREGR